MTTTTTTDTQQLKRVVPDKGRGGRWIQFGDELYRVPALGFKALSDPALAERLHALNAEGMPAAQRIETVLVLVHAAMVRNYPALTLDDVAAMVDVGNAAEVTAAVLHS